MKSLILMSLMAVAFTSSAKADLYTCNIDLHLNINVIEPITNTTQVIKAKNRNAGVKACVDVLESATRNFCAKNGPSDFLYVGIIVRKGSDGLGEMTFGSGWESFIKCGNVTESTVAKQSFQYSRPTGFSNLFYNAILGYFPVL